MKDFLNKIRMPQSTPLSKKLLYSFLIFFAGVVLGVISKFLDTIPGNLLPHFFEVLDLRNFLSRTGIWLFLGVLISVYGRSPLRSAVNVFLFFAGMVGSYYLYTSAEGFLPKSYMMIWIIAAAVSPLLAFVCWYARGKGMAAVLISAVIFALVSRQAFAFGFWYFDIRNALELLIWIAMIFVLYQSPKQIIRVTAIGLLLFFATSQINFFGGML